MVTNITNVFKDVVVMFSDIAGSTRLYEKLGDRKAKKIIDAGVNGMIKACGNQSGTVIKTIGDEVMCVFETADSAFSAALIMQSLMAADPELYEQNLQLRIGFHFGPVIVDQQDVFGDNVNISARVVGIAKAGQILTTAETLQHLAPVNRAKCRPFVLTPVKGKQEQIEVWEVLWNEDSTVLVHSSTPTLSNQKLMLSYNKQVFKLDPVIGNSLTIGRGVQVDIVIDAQYVSRIHLKIDFRRDKYMVSDNSFNGTFIQANGKIEFLHREEMVLSGEGILSLGKPFTEENPHLIQFKIC